MDNNSKLLALGGLTALWGGSLVLDYLKKREAPLAPTPKGLVFAYDFLEGSGYVAYDSSGNEINAGWIGGAGTAKPNWLTKRGISIKDGFSSSFCTPWDAKLDLSTGMTLEALFYLRGGKPTGQRWSYFVSRGDIYALLRDEATGRGEFVFTLGCPEGPLLIWLYTQEPLVEDKVHHLVGTYEHPGDISLWLNGIQQPINSAVSNWQHVHCNIPPPNRGPLARSNYGICLGQHSPIWPSSWAPADLLRVSGWNRSLNPPEILARHDEAQIIARDLGYPI